MDMSEIELGTVCNNPHLFTVHVILHNRLIGQDMGVAPFCGCRYIRSVIGGHWNCALTF